MLTQKNNEFRLKYVDEFRQMQVAQGLSRAIGAELQPGRDYYLMEFCGGHTHTLFKYALPSLLPSQIKFVHGPGCPVCVMPASPLQNLIELSLDKNNVIVSYGDILRVPSQGKKSLAWARMQGANVEMVYSGLEAIKIAQQNPHKKVIFFGIGFETTAPGSALLLEKTIELGLTNLYLYCQHYVTPAALEYLLSSVQSSEASSLRIDGFIGPSHVSSIIGWKSFEPFVKRFKKPLVVSGFEPLDVLYSVLKLVKLLNENKIEVQNQYSRAISDQGNVLAQQKLDRFFELRESMRWRGLGDLPWSGYKIKKQFEQYDAELVFNLKDRPDIEPKGCICADVVIGLKKPNECKLFGRACTPEHPIGSCMVSSEGACGAYYNYASALD